MADSWVFWALLSALFAAGTAIFAKIGVENIDSDLATLIRTLIVAAVLAGLLAATGRLQPTAVAPRTWVFLTLSALATGASWLCYFRALKIGDAARVAPIDKLSVVAVALIGALALGERLSPSNWLGVGMIAAGAVLVAMR
ncbi:transporter [Rhodoblastus sphagnicola]|uniref:Transporter n=1 Tax=Rhodoblastus sphagnicola TaxID=333368 RepID=A0A2S6NBF2_9HYPH|nr:EamA family transporter [Rhodoblastus sphagnicola]MBB4197048.1 transporter family protein [Rhodoblastus sphagnicola]PPQ31945.1 transporter [Rhodoblastus sphagnicola]